MTRGEIDAPVRWSSAIIYIKGTSQNLSYGLILSFPPCIEYRVNSSGNPKINYMDSPIQSGND
jgi:hypothetical protein